MHRRSGSNATTSSTSLQLPRISACFLIRFDKRIGYTISWSRSIPGLELEGEVEYKALPSGSHNVAEDLVYFIHQGNAGLSVFVHESDSTEERNARFVAVGVLVPLDYGRFGRGWLHAGHLFDLAHDLLNDLDETEPLENYWRNHGLKGKDEESSQDEPINMSESIMLGSSSQELSPYHPILSMSSFLDEFGPLVFPIYRTALLRQRVLFLKQPPIRLACEYVYILSVIATIQPTLAKILPDTCVLRVTPLFNICIHDIPKLEQAAASGGYTDNDAEDIDSDTDEFDTSWIACTSDELFSAKPDLSDTRIQMPKLTAAVPAQKQWPSIQHSLNGATRATQRDLRRYRALRQALTHLQERQKKMEDDFNRRESDSQSHNFISRAEAQSVSVSIPAEGAIIESSSWAAVVYDSYMWWASAGERSADLQDEYEQDADLLFAAADVWDDAAAYTRRSEIDADPLTKSKSTGALEMAVVAYFQRLTTTIFELLSRVVGAAEAEVGYENTDEIPEPKVFVFKDDLTAMGLDPWSQNDREWVVEMVRSYFGREAEVQGASIECCGVKIY